MFHRCNQYHSLFTSVGFIRLVVTIHVFAHDHTYVWSRLNTCLLGSKRMNDKDEKDESTQ